MTRSLIRNQAADDDILLQSLFPYILDYLGLSILGLKALTNRLPLPLLLRQEHKHISDLIKKEPGGTECSAIVSGQRSTWIG